jgi:plasmid stability protein
MRTTLTLEDDVAAAIEQRRREHRHSLKREVNELLRVGLEHVDEPRPISEFRVEPLDVGGLLIDIDDMGALQEIFDAEDWERLQRQG